MEHNERQFKLAVLSPASVSDPVPLSHVSARGLAVGETVILLHPPLPLLGALTWIKNGGVSKMTVSPTAIEASSIAWKPSERLLMVWNIAGKPRYTDSSARHATQRTMMGRLEKQCRLTSECAHVVDVHPELFTRR